MLLNEELIFLPPQNTLARFLPGNSGNLKSSTELSRESVKRFALLTLERQLSAFHDMQSS